MILKEIKHYPEWNTVGAIWVDENDVTIKCHSYDQTQMDMLEDDLGGDSLEHAELMATVRNNQLPAPPAPPRNVKAEIAAMESAQLMPRATREFMLGFMEMNATPEQLALNPGYVKVKAFDDEIRALRGQM